MMSENDIDKTVIRIIQDYCFSNSAPIFCNEFAMTISPYVIKEIKANNLDLDKLKKTAKIRKDFFRANGVQIAPFCKGLFTKLNCELSLYEFESFYDSIVTFKRKMENGLSRAFTKEKVSEDELRCALALYIRDETFCEPRSSSGNSDITVPSKKIIIETKLWNGIEYYNSGFPELNDYLDKNNYTEGYYVVFDFNKTLNQVIKEQGEIFDIKYKRKLIHVVFVRMNTICPSQIYKEEKRNLTIVNQK